MDLNELMFEINVQGRVKGRSTAAALELRLRGLFKGRYLEESRVVKRGQRMFNSGGGGVW